MSELDLLLTRSFQSIKPRPNDQLQRHKNAATHVKQDAQLSQRDRAAGCVIVFDKSRRLEMGDNILQT